MAMIYQKSECFPEIEQIGSRVAPSKLNSH